MNRTYEIFEKLKLKDLDSTIQYNKSDATLLVDIFENFI